MGPMDFSEITTKSTLHLPPLSLSASLRAGAVQRRPPPRRAAGQLLLPHRPTRHPSDLLDPLPSALDLSSPCHATPASSAAATSPSPCLAQCSALDPHLSRVSAPRAPPHPIPLTLSPAPCPKPPEHRRCPPELRRARPHRRPATLALLRPCRPYL